MRPLRDVLPTNANNVLYVFYDFQTTQYRTNSDTAKEHVPNHICVQHFCASCELMGDVIIDCERYGRRRHYFLNDPVGDLLTYFCEPRPWSSKIVAIAHNAKTFDLHFILNRVIMHKWKPELNMNGLKIISVKMEHLVFLDSVSFLTCAPRKLPEAIGLQATKSWYPHYFST